MSMTTTRIRVGLALCALVGLGAQAAEPSGARAGQTYVAPSILFMGEDDENGLNSYVAPQIGLGRQITDRYALELLYGAGETEGEAGNNTDVDAQFFRLDALYTLGGEYWKPYAVGGVGRYRLDPESGAAFNSTRDTQFNLGLGLMRSITDRLAVRGDARTYYNLDTNESQPGLAMGLRYVLGGPTGPRDSDGDGVSDPTDRCPGTAPGTRVDMNGCLPDSDDDGVADASDACPRTPAGVEVDARGCALDGDRDGVPNHRDDCLNTPRGERVDDRGCTVREEPVAERIEMRLEFDFDSSDLRPAHYAEIERVAEFMREHPETSAQLEGHTDSRGTEAYNQALSERRAYSVRDYLIDEAMLDPRRITAVGHGESRPVADNSTDEGRQRNRRVEAVVETRDMSVRPRRD